MYTKIGRFPSGNTALERALLGLTHLDPIRLDSEKRMGAFILHSIGTLNPRKLPNVTKSFRNSAGLTWVTRISGPCGQA